MERRAGLWGGQSRRRLDGPLLGDRRQVRMVSGTTAGGTIDRTAGPKRCAIYQIRGLSFFLFPFFKTTPFLTCVFLILSVQDEVRTEVEGEEE